MKLSMTTNNFFQHPSGSALLYTVLLMTMFASISFVLSSIVLRRIGAERDIADSVFSLYAAESGVERALDILEDSRQAGIVLGDVHVENSALGNIATLSENLDTRGTKYSIDTINTKSSVSSLTQFFTNNDVRAQSLQVEMIDPAQPFVSRSTTVPKWLQLWWNVSSDCPSSESSALEASFVNLLAVPQEGTMGNDVMEIPAVDKLLALCEESEESDCTKLLHLTDLDIQPDTIIVRVQPLNCALTDMRMQFFAEGVTPQELGDIVPIPLYPTITATGDGRSTRHNVSVIVKWQRPAQGLADFVLYSVEAIQK